MKWYIVLSFVSLLVIGWMGCGETEQDGSTFTQQIAKEEKGSVVFIKVSTSEGEGVGSGIIVKSSGQILTAYHVIEGIREGWAKPFNGTWMPITGVVASDELKDLAVINVDPRNQYLQQSRLGAGESMSSGDPVVAIGNPLGLEYSVTEGIVSEIRTTPEGLTLIQTDAAVSPGNSGGPLFDQNGEVIGVVSFNLSNHEAQGQNLNFAVSIDEAKPLLGVPEDQFEPVQVGLAPPATRSTSNFSLPRGLAYNLDIGAFFTCLCLFGLYTVPRAHHQSRQTSSNGVWLICHSVVGRLRGDLLFRVEWSL